MTEEESITSKASIQGFLVVAFLGIGWFVLIGRIVESGFIIGVQQIGIPMTILSLIVSLLIALKLGSIVMKEKWSGDNIAELTSRSLLYAIISLGIMLLVGFVLFPVAIPGIYSMMPIRTALLSLVGMVP